MSDEKLDLLFVHHLHDDDKFVHHVQDDGKSVEHMRNDDSTIKSAPGRIRRHLPKLLCIFLILISTLFWNLDLPNALKIFATNNSPLYHKKTNSGANFSQKCKEVTVRREWSTLALEDRKAFTNAVNCLYDLPSKLDPEIFPGARNRYDDFVALHINVTLVIHFSGFFLPWHRHFLWLWTEALRNECGYNGDLPYWQWEKYYSDIYNNPIFDGSDGSMSGDGYFDGENRSGPDVGFPRGPLPRGNGGGCLMSGPFKGRMLNFGPYSWGILREDPPVLPSDWADWRPRCLNRDLTPSIARENHNHTVIKDLIEKPQNLPDWLVALQGAPGVPWIEANPHAGGHFLLGGTGADFFASPGDPTFFLHHSNVDRVWAKWVSRDPENRLYALHGTHTIFNKPPSPPVNVDDVLDMGIEDDGEMLIKNVLDRTAYCYKYDDE